MLSTLVVVMLAALPLQAGQDTQATDAAAAGAELQAAVKQLSAASGYTFERTSRSEGGGFGGGGMGRGGAAGSSDPIVGRVGRDQVLHLTMGDTEAWRQGEIMVYRLGSDAWQTYEAPDFGERGFGGRRRGESGGRGGRDGGDFRSMRALMGLQTSTPPHEILGDLEAHLADIARSDEEGRIVYSGKLTEDGATAVGGGMAGRMRRGGGDIDVSGTFRIVLAENGGIDTIAFDTALVGAFGDREFQRDQHVEIVLSAIDETQVEVPEDVVAALAGEPTGEGADVKEEVEEIEEVEDEDELPEADDEVDPESNA